MPNLGDGHVRFAASRRVAVCNAGHVTATREAAHRVLHTSGVTAVARVGLVARTVFYLVLSGLAVAVCVGDHPRQTNSHGALALLDQHLLGKALIALAAVGFLALGVVQIIAAVRNKSGARANRILTGLKGGFYCFLAWIPITYLSGHHSTGSEKAQHKDTGQLLGMPAGRELVFATGLVLVIVCGWQIRGALADDFTSGLDLPDNTAVRRIAVWSGRAGIIARAIVFLPIAGFLISAALDTNPGQAKGLDAELLTLARYPAGVAILALVAAGLFTFAVYSGVEAAYRDLTADR